jgi:hypothetical protein
MRRNGYMCKINSGYHIRGNTKASQRGTVLRFLQSEKENRIPLDSDPVSDCDVDRDYNFKIRIRFENEKHGSIWKSKSLIDFHEKIRS